MSRSTLNTLPESVRAELLTRCLSYNHLTVNDHLSWLLEQGHTVSRSSLHRYLTAQKEGAMEAEQRRQDAIKSEERMRFKCLEIAAGIYKGNDQQELLGVAEDLMEWILMTDASREPVV